MILVVGDPKTYQLLTLTIFALIEREHDTTVLLLRIAHLIVLRTAVHEPRVVQAVGIADRHGDDIILLHLRGIKVAGTKEYRHHVVDARLISGGIPQMLAAGSDAVLFQLTVAVGIAIPYLVDIVAVAFHGSLAEVDGCETCITVGEQRVSHDKELVEFGIASGDEVRHPGILALKLRHFGVHLGSTHLHPNELPIEIEVVVEFLARLKGCILYPTLGITVVRGKR